MSRLVLHHCHQARSMRSLWLLHELGLDFDLRVHDFFALRTPDYLVLHALGRVPLLEDGDLRLHESGAICEYLCETRDTHHLWRAPGTPERAEWLQWLHYAETIGQHIAILTQQHIVIRDDEDRSGLVMWLEARRLEKTLQLLEAALEGREWLLASGFTAVDTGIGYSVYAARHFVDIGPYPNLAAYWDRVQARAAFRRSLPPAEAPPIYARPFYAAPER